MKLLFFPVAAILFAGQAYGQTFTGAEINVDTYSYSRVGPWQSGSIDGSVEVGFGAISLQLDVGAMMYDFDSNANYSVGLHGIYNISDNIALGAFYIYEDWQATNTSAYQNYGLEAKVGLPDMPLTIEAYWLFEEGVLNDIYTANIYAVEAVYALNDRVSLLFGYSSLIDTVTTDFMVGGIKYAANDNFDIRFQVVSVSDGSTGVGMSLSQSFGAGTRFGQRDWDDFLWGW